MDRKAEFFYGTRFHNVDLVVSTIPFPYIMLNDRHEIIAANKHYLALVGQPMDAIAGKRIYDVQQFGPLEKRAIWTRWLEDILLGIKTGDTRTSTLFRYATNDVLKTGGVKPIHISLLAKASAIQLDKTDNILVGVVISDFTQSSNQEADEKRVTAQEPLELVQARVISMERELRSRGDANADAMDQFVAAVSHELRSPIAAILSWITVLRQSNDHGKIARAGDVIDRNARQLLRMIDDLLDNGAVATNKLTMVMKPIDLTAVVANAIENIRPIVDAKNVELNWMKTATACIMGDESRLNQVVGNLLSNALKFCVAGRVEVAVEKNETHAILLVQDSGCGIDPTAIDKIFERFEQAAQASAGRAGGLGLGLWLVKNIVAGHGGTITVESAGLGMGTTFQVCLPLHSGAPGRGGVALDGDCRKL